jgi:hypothetical protein
VMTIGRYKLRCDCQVFPEREACHCKTGSPDEGKANNPILLALIPALSPGLSRV